MQRAPRVGQVHGLLRAGLALALAACSGNGQSTSEGPLTTSSTSDATGTSGTTDACDDSRDCDTDDICAAPYTVEEDSYGGERGPAACVPGCIEAWDLSRWCFDHSACCGTDRCKEVDGVCEPLDPDTTSSTGTESTESSTESSAGSTTMGTGSTGSTTADTGESTGASSSGTGDTSGP